MKTKAEKIALMHSMLSGFGLTVEDLLSTPAQESLFCDLLCKTEDMFGDMCYMRLPFEQHRGEVIGICWSSIDEALLLEEKNLNWEQALEYSKELSKKLCIQASLPDKDTLEGIYGTRCDKINKTLQALGLNLLTNYGYWSGSESSKSCAWAVFRSGDVASVKSKDFDYSARCIVKF